MLSLHAKLQSQRGPEVWAQEQAELFFGPLRRTRADALGPGAAAFGAGGAARLGSGA